jgi:hypothetical protein
METPTGTFINIVEALYNKSLGPWCIIERLSNSWLFGLHPTMKAALPWANPPILGVVSALDIMPRGAS